MSVSRKVGNAVTRNRVRRRLREVFYSMHDELPAGLDLVVSARPACAEASFEDIEKAFVWALEKLNCLEGTQKR